MVALALIVSRLSIATVQRAQAQTAADAAALAGAQELVSAGQKSAGEMVRRNGASMRSYLDDGSEITVVAEVEDSSARASVRRLAVRPLDQALAFPTIAVR